MADFVTLAVVFGAGVPMVIVGLLTGLRPERWFRRSHGITGGTVATRQVRAYQFKSFAVALVGFVFVGFGL